MHEKYKREKKGVVKQTNQNTTSIAVSQIMAQQQPNNIAVKRLCY